MKNIYAQTETNAGNPGYISINDNGDDNVSVSVRTRTAQAVSVIHLTVDQLRELSDALVAYFPAPAPVIVADEPVATKKVK